MLSAAAVPKTWHMSNYGWPGASDYLSYQDCPTAHSQHLFVCSPVGIFGCEIYSHVVMQSERLGTSSGEVKGWDAYE